MELIYDLFGTDKDGFFNAIINIFERIWAVLLPILLSAKFDEIFGTND